jgi:hypothetical protein
MAKCFRSISVLGKYISEISRGNFWGTNAIEVISLQLQQELPGLRGFGVANIKYMRLFYEGWRDVINCHLPSDEIANEFLLTENKNIVIRPPVAGELEIDDKFLISEIRKMATVEFNWEYFLRKRGYLQFNI